MKKVLVKVLRTHPKKGNQFWQTFEYEGRIEATIGDVLDEINSREKIIDTNLDVATPILWDRKCEEGLCGSCAMVINRVPRLACSTLLNDVMIQGEVELRPLTKFPIVADLMVDRSIISEGLKDMNLWLESRKASQEDQQTEEQKAVDQTEAQKAEAQCTACGCCLEACSNYAGDADFIGAMTANAEYLAYKEANDPEHVVGLKKKYKKKFFNGCSKSLMCEKVCPLGIPGATDFSKMDSISVWRIWQQK